MIFKIDMEKAYDHVEWCFVDYMLGHLGFSSKWRAWIWEGISSTSLINGSPCRLFKASLGLRQGDPLSPFMFTIVVKALSALFCMAKEIGLIEGCDVGGGEKAITLLQFMDDTILFSSTQCKEVIVLKRIPICFGPALGLKVNLSKSVLVGLWCAEEEVHLSHNMLHCTMRKLSLVYLGSHTRAIREIKEGLAPYFGKF